VNTQPATPTRLITAAIGSRSFRMSNCPTCLPLFQ
jgi:hypothetical protein